MRICMRFNYCGSFALRYAPLVKNLHIYAASAMSGVYSVCLGCFRSDPINCGELDAIECYRHPNEGRVDVVWDGVSNRFVLYQIRPVPDIEIKGRFITCRFGSQCSKGQRCTYAHTEAEQREWNKLIKSGKLFS